MITRLEVDAFLQLGSQHVIIDVRSPSEYEHAHITSAINLPLFTDEQRAIVGTSYKQRSRQEAIKIGLTYFGPNMLNIVETVEALVAKNSKNNAPDVSEAPTVLVHCWRGGMRSGAIAWLLDLYGFKVYTLKGGYKAYRQWVLQTFELKFPFSIIGGYTGSGKTYVLQELKKAGEPIVDLELLAVHKGSAFGGFDGVQPTQEQFENKLAEVLRPKLDTLTEGQTIWLEDESRRIGLVNIPLQMWNQMRASKVYFMDIPFEARLQHILADYSHYRTELLVNAVIRIEKRLGGLQMKEVISHILDHQLAEAFAILLRYYDKFYLKGLYNRDNIEAIVVNIPCTHIEPRMNATTLIRTRNNEHIRNN